MAFISEEAYRLTAAGTAPVLHRIPLLRHFPVTGRKPPQHTQK
ncbi:hypothetical protein NC99_38690 [Sunxiuqinia dokdonensis]|uniref:Uncharacterized protein n=1 Tax=Sunxiuqinia dokdonensis TaxID=1409788 RepID=A0A0L8V4F7_9BACT|nr:hypothetical protein NC99_38690 [Sunxiuqinia dokdonensis]